MSNRISWIDTIKGITIFLVVLGHTILPQNWLNYIFSFHMPLFFFLSGYLFNPEKYPSFFGFAIKKVKTLLWPYLVFFAIGFIYWAFYFNPKNYLDAFWQLVLSGDRLYAPFIPLWFLTCLFLLENYFYLIQKYLNKWILLIAVTASTLLGFYFASHHIHLFWGADIALVATSFYYLGFEIKRNKQITSFINSNWLPLGAAILLLINFILAYLHNFQSSMFYRFYGNNWMFIAAGITGTIAYFFAGKYLKDTILKNITIFEYLGKNSLIILGLHTVTYYYVTDFFNYQLHITPKTSVLYAFVYTIITLLVLWPIIYLINKTPLLSFKKNN